jgi:hypothetical protein
MNALVTCLAKVHYGATGLASLVEMSMHKAAMASLDT